MTLTVGTRGPRPRRPRTPARARVHARVALEFGVRLRGWLTVVSFPRIRVDPRIASFPLLSSFPIPCWCSPYSPTVSHTPALELDRSLQRVQSLSAPGLARRLAYVSYRL